MDLTTLTEEELHSLLDAIIAGELPASGFPYSAETATSRLAKALYERCLHEGRRSLILSRVFQSLRSAELPEDLVRGSGAGDLDPDERILTLLGTWGDEPNWCDRTRSEGHQTIRLNGETVTHIPMLSRALRQIGIDLDILPATGEDAGLKVTSFGSHVSAFHVEKAPGSPYVPAQEEFVLRHSVESVVGCAARLRGNEISLYIGFSRHRIPEAAAEAFAPLMVLFWQRLLPIVDRPF